MNPSTLSTFFSKHVDKEFELEKFWKNLLFISANEWHWTQQELYETDIPYILILLEGREIYIKELNKKR